MTGKPAFFMLWLNAPESREAEWNEWVNKVHIPARLAIPGFLYARRYEMVEGSHKYFHLYALESADVLFSKPYVKLREKEASKGDPSAGFLAMTHRIPDCCRGVYEQIFPKDRPFTAPQKDFTLTVGIDIPKGRDEEFNAWYETDHIPGNLSIPGWIDAHRFVLAKPEISPGRPANSARYVAVWQIATVEASHQNPVYDKIRHSPWSKYVHTWYNRRYRTLFRCIY